MLDVAFTQLPVNVALRRHQPERPCTSLTESQFAALQDHLPSRGEQWEQVYNTRDHGSNFDILKRLCQEYHAYSKSAASGYVLVASPKPPPIQQQQAPLVGTNGDEEEVVDAPDPSHIGHQHHVAGNSIGDTRSGVTHWAKAQHDQRIMGAYFPTTPFADDRYKKYYGTEGVFVFRSPTAAEAAETEEKGVSGAPLVTITVPPTKEEAEEAALHRSNNYFMRHGDGELFVGGGGMGPMLRITNDLRTGQSAVQCDTFGVKAKRGPLLDPAWSAVDVEGEFPINIILECGVAETELHCVELWALRRDAGF